VQCKSHPHRPFSTRTSGYTNRVVLCSTFSSLKETRFEFDVELQYLLKTEVKYNAFIEASGKPQCLCLRSCTHHTWVLFLSYSQRRKIACICPRHLFFCFNIAQPSHHCISEPISLEISHLYFNHQRVELASQSFRVNSFCIFPANPRFSFYVQHYNIWSFTGTFPCLTENVAIT